VPGLYDTYVQDDTLAYATCVQGASAPRTPPCTSLATRPAGLNVSRTLQQFANVTMKDTR
jgi:hypothetical protein